MDDLIQRLREALAAFPKGWESAFAAVERDEDDEEGIVQIGGRHDDNDLAPVISVDTGNYYRPQDAEPLARYIAAANPAAIRALLDEIERLRAEVHNLNWALGTPGYERMATDEEQAEHEAGMQRVNDLLERMKKNKAEHDRAMADAARYRWMKENVKRIPPGWGLIGWDAAIDAAIAAQEADRG